MYSKDDINSIVANLENYIASLEAATEKIRGGSDCEKGYLLEKIQALQSYVKRAL